MSRYCSLRKKRKRINDDISEGSRCGIPLFDGQVTENWKKVVFDTIFLDFSHREDIKFNNTIDKYRES